MTILPSHNRRHNLIRLVVFLSLALLFSTTSSSTSAQLESSPDLIISDIWTLEGSLCYQVQNTGLADAAGGHEAQLSIDGSPYQLSYVEDALKPGERFNFDCIQQYACSGVSDQVVACADVKYVISESNENNNCRQETMPCDQTPPMIIKGPLVSNVTETSATISWDTDEEGDSAVEFDQAADQYSMVVRDPAPVKFHEIELANLEPGGVYQFRVTTQDSAGNLARSAGQYLVLNAPADSEDPQNGEPILTRIPGSFVRFHATLPASDNMGVDRVEMYLDDTLIGTDYSPDANGMFGMELIPGAIGQSHLDFFSPHTITTRAYDRFGWVSRTDIPWSPPSEPMDGELEILSPDPDTVFYFPDSVTPRYERIEFEVHAAQYTAELCPPPGVGGDLECRHVLEPVARIEYTFNSETWVNSPATIDKVFSLDAGELPMGDYPLIVEAYANDGSSLTAGRVIHLRQGAPDLVLDRNVIREGHALRVNLELENQGTLPIEILSLDDNATGFQIIDTVSPHYLFEAVYDPIFRQSNIHVDLHSGTGWNLLGAGEKLTISYLAVPILGPYYPLGDYSIGTESVRVRSDFYGVVETRSYSLRRNQTNDGERFIDAIEDMRRDSDYLIVTDPRLVGVRDYGSGLADELLDRLAELTLAKDGMLAYLEDYPNKDETDDRIEAWGRTMRGSDGSEEGYLRDGYLLLVGETNIIPAGAIRFSGHWWWDDRTVGLTDAFFADTTSNLIDPELKVGRIIGDSLADLLIPIETTLNVENDVVGYGYDRSSALLFRGFDEMRNGSSNASDFGAAVSIVEDQLNAFSIPYETFNSFDYGTREQAVDAFRSELPGRDILFLAGHGSPWSLDDLESGDLDGYRDVFVGSNPIVYGSSCNTGRFIEPGSFGEKFLQAGAGVYFGSTEISYGVNNRAGASAIFQRLDPGRSIGSIIKEVKISLGSAWLYGFLEDYWTAEYNLYGDPEYGRSPYSPSEISSSLDSPNISETVTKTYSIPSYILTKTTDGKDWLEIPGGYWLTEIGYPVVPDYVVQEPIEPGYQVQDVRLTSRNNMSRISPLDLPVFTDSPDGSNLAGLMELDELDLWPGYDFNWQVNQNKDGSSTLTIQIFPLQYRPLAGEAFFYQDYTFEIITAPAGAQISSLETDQDAYLPGEPVNLSILLHNDPASPADMLLAVEVNAPGHTTPVDGLPLRLLKSAAGDVWVEQSWDSGGFPPGDYSFNVELLRQDGGLIHAQQTHFKLGITAGEMDQYMVSPQSILPDDEVIIEFDFTNTGSETLAGQAIVEIVGEAPDPVAVLTQEFADLGAHGETHFKFVWQVPFDALGSYRIVAYVQYESQTTPPMEAYVQTPRFFLPIIAR